MAVYTRIILVSYKQIMDHNKVLHGFKVFVVVVSISMRLRPAIRFTFALVFSAGPSVVESRSSVVLLVTV